MWRGAHSAGFFNHSGGSNPNGGRTTSTRGRARGLGRNRSSIRIVEDGQPNDSLSRNRDHIPNVLATHRPYHHIRKHGTNGFPSHRTSHNPYMFQGLQSNPPTGPQPLSSINTTRSVPSGPVDERGSILLLDDLAPRKRRRTESPPPTAPNTHIHFHPMSPVSENHKHSFTRETGPRSRAVVADITDECEQSPLSFSVNAKRESPPVDIDMLDCPQSPPLFEKLGLLEKTSGSYYFAMIDECRKGAISWRARRKEWVAANKNAIRFVRGHDFPPLTIERCFTR